MIPTPHADRRPSRATSIASADARRGSAWSRTSSVLPYSTRSEGSTFYYGDSSTLSRAVLHNSGEEEGDDDDDEEDDRDVGEGRELRARRSGWHRSRNYRRGQNDSAAAEEADGDNVGEADVDGEDGSDAERRQQQQQQNARRGSTARSSQILPFGSDSGYNLSSQLGQDRTSFYNSNAHNGTDATRRRSYSTHSEMDSADNPSSSLYDHDDDELSCAVVGGSLLSSQRTDFNDVSASERTRGGSEGLFHRSPRRLQRPPMLAAKTLAAAATSRPSSVSGDLPSRVSATSSAAGNISSVTTPSTRHSRYHHSNTSMTAATDGTSAGDRSGSDVMNISGTADRTVSRKGLKLPFFTSNRRDGADCQEPLEAAAAAAAVERVWPYTQQLEVRIIMTHIRKRIEWNHTMRQFLLLVPLIFLFSFYAAYNTSVTSTGVLVTEALQGLLTRTPFPSSVASLERYRQQTRMQVPVSVPTDRFFEHIRTQMDWIDFFADTLMPAIFPGAADVVNLTLDVPSECVMNASTYSSSSGDDDCFSDGQYWWDRPGCYDSGSETDWTFSERVPQLKHLQPRQATGAKRDGVIRSTSNPQVDGDATDGGQQRNARAAATLAEGRSSSEGSSDEASSPCHLNDLLYDKGVLLGPGQSVYLGALRVRTIRMQPHSAKLQRRLYPADPTRFPQDAWSRGHSRQREETTAARCPSIRLTNPFTRQSRPIYVYRSPEANDPYCVATDARYGTYHCGGYTFDVPFRASTWLAAQYRAAVLSPACYFVDNWATRFVVIEFYTYTPDHDIFHLVKLRSEVMSGGHYHNTAEFRVFQVWTPTKTGSLVYVAILLAYTALYVFFLLCRLRWQYRVFGWVAIVEDWSAWMDLCMTSGIVVSIAFYFSWVRLSRRVSPSLAVPMMSDAYPDFLDALYACYDRCVVAKAFTILLCFSRLFFYRALFRPFSTFVAALELSLPTLIATWLLFFLLILGYTVAAYTVFGPASPLYNTFGEALYSVLAYWYSTVYVIPSDEVVARQFTSLFFWSLTTMVLAIVAGSYIAVVAHSFSRLQSIFGVTFDEQWLMRQVRSLGQRLTWPRMKWFVGKMLTVYPENAYLLRLLEHMDAVFYAAPSDTNSVETSGQWRGCATTPSDIGQKKAATGELHEGDAAGPRTVVAPIDTATIATSAQQSGSPPSTPSRTHIIRRSATAESSPPASPQERATKAPPPPLQSLFAVEVERPAGAGAESSNVAKTAKHWPLFRQPVRRTSEELHEIHDELRELALTQRPINFFDWCRAIPPDVFERCGGTTYFKNWWRSMAETQADVSRTPEEQKRRDFREKVAIATERGVASGIVGIGHLEHTLTQLELHVDSLLKNVTKR
uniref:Polycystin domain-containing protein n=1 Tax=Angomonas deanei TaxID=59799 RepID=C6K3L0_9TRYP|nr:hypothetical protein CDFL1M01_03 [Angomonas deanei]